MAEDYTVVKNVRGKADVWRQKDWWAHWAKFAVCFDCGVSVKLACGTSNLQTHIRRHHPLKQAVRSKSVVQAEASTSQSTVTQVPSTSNVKTVSAENSKQTTIVAAFGATSSQKHYPAQLPRASEITKQLGRFLAKDVRLFFYLKYTLGKGKLCLQRLKKVRLLQYLGVSDVTTIKRKKQ